LALVPCFNAYQNHSSKCSPQRFLEAVRHHSASLPRPDHDLTAMHLMHTASDHSPTYPQSEPPSHPIPGESLRATHSLQIFVMNYWTATRPAD